jgi:hypothetical protein
MDWLEVRFPGAYSKRRKRFPKAVAVRGYINQASRHNVSECLALAYLEVYTSLGIVHYVGHRKDIPRDLPIPAGSDVTDWIFNPAWVKGPVYHLVRTPTGEHDHAVFDQTGIDRRFAQPAGPGDEQKLWKRTSFEPQDARRVLALMTACGLCFPFEALDAPCWLIPDLLPERPTPSVWDEGDAALRELAYDFLPENVLLRFIGKRYAWVRDRVGECFRNEVILRPDGQPCAALVQADYTANVIRVTIRGGGDGERNRLFDIIAADLADIMEPSGGAWDAWDRPDAAGTKDAVAPDRDLPWAPHIDQVNIVTSHGGAPVEIRHGSHDFTARDISRSTVVLGEVRDSVVKSIAQIPTEKDDRLQQLKPLLEELTELLAREAPEAGVSAQNAAEALEEVEAIATETRKGLGERVLGTVRKTLFTLKGMAEQFEKFPAIAEKYQALVTRIAGFFTEP